MIVVKNNTFGIVVLAHVLTYLLAREKLYSFFGLYGTSGHSIDLSYSSKNYSMNFLSSFCSVQNKGDIKLSVNRPVTKAEAVRLFKILLIFPKSEDALSLLQSLGCFIFVKEHICR